MVRRVLCRGLSIPLVVLVLVLVVVLVGVGCDASTPWSSASFAAPRPSRRASSAAGGGDDYSPCSSRREWLERHTQRVVSVASVVSIPLPAAASTPRLPLTAELADSFPARLERSLRLKPPKVLRSRLKLEFAVLLMRSSYNALDDLDVVAMDIFQRDFFLIRQAEYGYYRDSLGGGAMLQQGDLCDPNYFDFISFAQFKTITRELSNPPNIFAEQQPIEEEGGDDAAADTAAPLQRFKTVVVTRDASLTKADLANKHDTQVGNAILDNLNKIFDKTAASIPKLVPNTRPNQTDVKAALTQLVNLFVISGFALDGKVTLSNQNSNGDESARGTTVSIALTSPATLWSGQALKASNTPVTNDFASKAARMLVSRAGYVASKATVNYDNFREVSTFILL